MEFGSSEAQKEKQNANIAPYVFNEGDQLHRSIQYTCMYTADGSRIKVTHSNRKVILNISSSY